MIWVSILTMLLTVAVAFLALCISVAALALSIMEARQRMRHARFSMMPILILDIKSPPEDEFRICLHNAGLGPAILETLAVTIDDEPFAHGPVGVVVVDWKTLLPMIGLRDPVAFRSRLPHAEESIAADRDLELFRFVNTPYDSYDTGEIKSILGAFTRVGIIVEYSSIYGDRSVLRTPVSLHVPPAIGQLPDIPVAAPQENA